MAALIPIQGSDAETPVRLYFFDENNDCIAEIILIPGEPLNGADMPWHGTNKEWYDDGGERVYGNRTFESGDYIIKAYTNPPVKPTDPSGNDGLSDTIIIAITIISMVGIIAVGCLLIFKK